MTRLDVVLKEILLVGWFIESKSIKFEGTSGHFAVKSLRVWVTPINHPSHPEQEEAFRLSRLLKRKRTLIDDRLKGRNHAQQQLNILSKTNNFFFSRRRKKLFGFFRGETRAEEILKNKKSTFEKQKNLVIDDVRMNQAKESKARWAQQLDKRIS